MRWTHPQCRILLSEPCQDCNLTLPVGEFSDTEHGVGRMKVFQVGGY